MKTWNEAKKAYIKDHLSKPLKSPNIRLGALEKIETYLKKENKNLAYDIEFFKKYNESSLLDYYLRLKGKQLNSAEKSVIHGLSKFAV